jgi:hypothetical protein
MMLFQSPHQNFRPVSSSAHQPRKVRSTAASVGVSAFGSLLISGTSYGDAGRRVTDFSIVQQTGPCWPTGWRVQGSRSISGSNFRSLDDIDENATSLSNQRCDTTRRTPTVLRHYDIDLAQAARFRSVPELQGDYYVGNHAER